MREASTAVISGHQIVQNSAPYVPMHDGGVMSIQAVTAAAPGLPATF